MNERFENDKARGLQIKTWTNDYWERSRSSKQPTKWPLFLFSNKILKNNYIKSIVAKKLVGDKLGKCVKITTVLKYIKKLIAKMIAYSGKT